MCICDWKVSFIGYEYNNNNTTSQCGSRFRGVWGDPAVGNLTSIGIPTHREVDSKRPTKRFCEKRFKEESVCEAFKEGTSVPKRLKLKLKEAKRKLKERTSTIHVRQLPSLPEKSTTCIRARHTSTSTKPLQLTTTDTLLCHLKS